MVAYSRLVASPFLWLLPSVLATVLPAQTGESAPVEFVTCTQGPGDLDAIHGRLAICIDLMKRQKGQRDGSKEWLQALEEVHKLIEPKDASGATKGASKAGAGDAATASKREDPKGRLLDIVASQQSATSRWQLTPALQALAKLHENDPSACILYTLGEALGASPMLPKGAKIERAIEPMKKALDLLAKSDSIAPREIGMWESLHGLGVIMGDLTAKADEIAFVKDCVERQLQRLEAGEAIDPTVMPEALLRHHCKQLGASIRDRKRDACVKRLQQIEGLRRGSSFVQFSLGAALLSPGGDKPNGDMDAAKAALTAFLGADTTSPVLDHEKLLGEWRDVAELAADAPRLATMRQQATAWLARIAGPANEPEDLLDLPFADKGWAELQVGRVEKLIRASEKALREKSAQLQLAKQQLQSRQQKLDGYLRSNRTNGTDTTDLKSDIQSSKRTIDRLEKRDIPSEEAKLVDLRARLDKLNKALAKMASPSGGADANAPSPPRRR